MEKGCLSVSMLGGLNIEYEGRVIRLPLDLHSITVQLLIFLWDAGDKGLSRDVILNRLYGENEVSNPANSMRVNIFRARKILGKLGLPEHEYISTEHGFYRWDAGETTLRTDVGMFSDCLDQAWRAASREEQNSLLNRACDLYRGEFLPELAAEQWAAVKTVDYGRMYGKAVVRLYHNYMEEKKYENAVSVSGRALKIYPYENFAIMKIDALTAQGRFQEAMETLDELSRQMFRNLGIALSDDIMQRYEEIGGHIGLSYTAIKKIKTQLEEEVVKGAYYCSFPSFVDCYRILSRISVRSGQTLFLVNCVMIDSKGRTLQSGDSALSTAPIVMKAIEEALRSGDVYTKGNENQFLILLSGLTLENCSLVTDRIDSNFRKKGVTRGVKLDFHITAAVSSKKK